MILDLAAEPRDAPPLQRARGEARIEAKTAEGATRLARLYQDGCGKIRLPADAAARDLEAVMINTSGGLTGGDRMAWAPAPGPARPDPDHPGLREGLPCPGRPG